MSLIQILAAALAFINLTALLVMFNDKRRSTRSTATERIPEGILFFIATAFGAIGIYVGMFLFRHKIRKWYFQIGIPLLIAEQLILLYFGSMFLLSPIY